MTTLAARPRQAWLTPLVHVAALAPLVWIGVDALSGGLTVNPIQELTSRTGKIALVLLMLSLACTPLHALLGMPRLLKLRRPLGLYAFLYAALHLLVFAVLDNGLDWEIILETVFEKRFALVGFAAFVILTPLAVTSTKWWQKQLGKRWKLLHKLVYVAASLAILHFILLVKSLALRPEPLVWGFVLAILLIARAPFIRRQFVAMHNRFARPVRIPSQPVSGRKD
ncbi:MAG: sulfoxide reductase heme-binding subunit YedZ [Roseiflexaceae bacterium]|nr:sulfoxide reductase heme-binding subunit YedZ [Roseiflexaceae bacterium]